MMRPTLPPACDPLPANCPFTKRLPKGRDHIRQAIEDRVIPCCGMMRPFWSPADEPPLCQIEADEVYRFFYMQAFGEHAMILVGKRRDEVTVERRYYPGLFCNEAERFEALLTEADWQRLQRALAAAEFWSLPRHIHPDGLWLDGYDMIVEARSGT